MKKLSQLTKHDLYHLLVLARENLEVAHEMLVDATDVDEDDELSFFEILDELCVENDETA